MTTGSVFTVGGEGPALAAEQYLPSGEPRGRILLLHGGGQTRHSWRKSVGRIVASGWEAIAYDSRGHGESEWAADASYSLDDLVADAARVAMSVGTPVILCGASMGGITALALQAAHPEIGQAIILVDITPRIEPAGAKRIVSFMSGAPDGFASLYDANLDIAEFSGRSPQVIDEAGLRRILRHGDDGRWRWHWDPVFLGARTADLEQDSKTLRRAALGVRVPTLLIRGGASDIVSLEGAQELLDLIPQASFVDVIGAGHMVAGDDNDAFTTAILNFLKALPA